MLSLVHSDEYVNWIFDPNHPTQGRRFINGYSEILKEARIAGIPLAIYEPFYADREYLRLAHSDSYIDEVLDKGVANEWVGSRLDLADLAQLFVGGTLLAALLLAEKRTTLAVNLPGAKHHAQFQSSSGFCIFNDFAIAAKIVNREFNKKIAIIDIDAHHGDGTQNLTEFDLDIITFSIHEYGIFPGTGLTSKEGVYYNYPLKSGDGDSELVQSLKAVFLDLDLLKSKQNWVPDLLFIACGADGHILDPLANLEYTVSGFIQASQLIKSRFKETPILVGGAGGYLPDSKTPEVWAKFIIELAK